MFKLNKKKSNEEKYHEEMQKFVNEQFYPSYMDWEDAPRENKKENGELFCSYCDTKLFSSDRTCPSCGAGTKTAIYFNRHSKPYNKPEVFGAKGSN